MKSMFGATMLHGVHVVVDELAAPRAHVLERGRETPRACGLVRSRVNRGKLWPASHFSTSMCQSVNSTDDRLMSGFRPIAAPSRVTPRALGGEERPIARAKAVDLQVLDDDSPRNRWMEMRPMRIGRSRYFEPSLGARSYRRTQIDRQRCHDCGGQDRHHEHQARRRCGKAFRTREGRLHGFSRWITTSSAPASTNSPSRAWTSATVPAPDARSSFSIFIASTTTIG